MAVESHVFTYLGETLANVSEAFLVPAATRLVTALTPVAITGVTLHLMLMGYMVLTGAVQESFYTTLKQSAKVMLVAAFALKSDAYFSWIVTAIQGLEAGLVSALSPDIGRGTIYLTLDGALNRGFELGATCFERCSSAGLSQMGSAISWVVAGLAVLAGTIAITLLGAVNIIVAKLSLVVVLALGPLFILSLMWPVTARFFDSWFSQVFNYVLVTVVMAALMSFAIKSFDHFIAAANFNDSQANPIIAAAQILVLSLVLGYLLSQASAMAAGLAGGMSLAALSVRHLSGAWRTGRSAAGALNPTSTRTDPTSGQQVTASRAQHQLAGRTVLNPRYRQALTGGLRAHLGHCRQNWGPGLGGSAKKG